MYVFINFELRLHELSLITQAIGLTSGSTQVIRRRAHATARLPALSTAHTQYLNYLLLLARPLVGC